MIKYRVFGGGGMAFLWMSLFAFGIVAVDQFTKFVVLENIALYEKVPFLPGFIGFTYAQNTGGAWSLFSGMMWLFVAVFAVLTVLIFVEYFWKRMPFTTFERWCIAAIYGGKIVKGDVVVIRYEGPAGGPGMREMLSPHISYCRYGS